MVIYQTWNEIKKLIENNFSPWLFLSHNTRGGRGFPTLLTVSTLAEESTPEYVAGAQSIFQIAADTNFWKDVSVSDNSVITCSHS